MAKGKYLGGASRRSLLQQFGAAAIGISFSGSLSACGQGGGGRVVNFYNWDTYIGPTTLADFQAATDVPVNMSLFATNDELFARLRAGNPGFDVIVPSNEFVTRMSQAQMIQELDHAQIPNMANLLPEFVGEGVRSIRAGATRCHIPGWFWASATTRRRAPRRACRSRIRGVTYSTIRRSRSAWLCCRNRLT